MAVPAAQQTNIRYLKPCCWCSRRRRNRNEPREEWLLLILRTREMTPELAKQIEGNKVFLCERHFKEDCILTYPKRKVLITDSVPTENLATKSHEIPKQERLVLVRPDVEASTSSSTTEPPTSIEYTSVLSAIEGLMTDLESVRASGQWKVERRSEHQIV